MKRSAIDHPKTRRLGRQLDLQVPWGPIGVMESLAHFTAKHAPRGDVGKWENAEIAAAIGWPADDADRLVDVLVEVGFLDRHPVHRLLVHDWPDHADDSVKKTLKARGETFAALDPLPDQSALPEDFRKDSGSFQPSKGKERQGKEREGKERNVSGAEIQTVYTYWRKHHPKAKASLPSKDPAYRKVRDRLADGYTVEELQRAIDGCHHTPFNLGENDRGEKHLGLELICRDADHVTRFIENADNPPKGKSNVRRNGQPERACTAI